MASDILMEPDDEATNPTLSSDHLTLLGRKGCELLVELVTGGSSEEHWVRCDDRDER
jgi:hypothetical protein